MLKNSLLLPLLLSLSLFAAGCIKTDTATVKTYLSTERRFNTENRLKVLANGQPYVVSISVQGKEDSVLTGFFIDSRGYILTAAHGLFKEARNVSVYLADGQKFPARFVGEIQTLDYAVLHIKSLVEQPVASFVSMEDFMNGKKRGTWFSESILSPEEGEKLLIACLCSNTDSSYKLGRTYIGTFHEWRRDSPTIGFTQLQYHMGGCSGAPVINGEQKVIGMVISTAGSLVNAVDADELNKGSRILIDNDKAGQ